MEEYIELQDLCFKLQAIVNRIKLHKAMKKEPNFEENVNFYNTIIPGFKANIKKRIVNKYNPLKHHILSFMVQEWIDENAGKCANFLKSTNQKTLTSPNRIVRNIKFLAEKE